MLISGVLQLTRYLLSAIDASRYDCPDNRAVPQARAPTYAVSGREAAL
jgi:hypothetical protein